VRDTTRSPFPSTAADDPLTAPLGSKMVARGALMAPRTRLNVASVLVKWSREGDSNPWPAHYECDRARIATSESVTRCPVDLPF
jgi:hypothetical protein